MSPLVGLLGHRQVGKTTLLEGISNQYLSFDDETMLASANSNPKAFIAALRAPGTAIDECQLSERIFPALKERVRKDKRPGQFYLSGSVRFTSKKLIRESLTGRIMTADLLPLTLSELDRAELPNLVPRLLRAHRMQDLQLSPLAGREHARRTRLIEHYDTHGGLPGACFIRDARLRTQKILDQLETILDRDLRQIHETTLTLPELLRFLRELALHDGTSAHYEDLRRATGISRMTQKRLLFALEAIFIIRHIPLEGDIHGAVLVFEDQAEVATLAQDRLSAEQRWTGLLYRNLREQVFYRVGVNAEFFQYRTRAGVNVPFALRAPDAVIGFIPVRGVVSRGNTAAAHSFLRRYARGNVVLVTDENETRIIDERTLLVPAAQLLFPCP
ncbi:MAG: ATP-binding protein [Steroidobacteraceae bacterium]